MIRLRPVGTKLSELETPGQGGLSGRFVAMIGGVA